MHGVKSRGKTGTKNMTDMGNETHFFLCYQLTKSTLGRGKIKTSLQFAHLNTSKMTVTSMMSLWFDRPYNSIDLSNNGIFQTLYNKYCKAVSIIIIISVDRLLWWRALLDRFATWKFRVPGRVWSMEFGSGVFSSGDTQFITWYFIMKLNWNYKNSKDIVPFYFGPMSSYQMIVIQYVVITYYSFMHRYVSVKVHMHLSPRCY